MRTVLLIALLSLLAGCGFQLRSEIALPAELALLRIEAVEASSGLSRDLQAALRRSGARFDAAPGETAARLRLPAASLGQRPLSVGGNGQVLEFALVYAVDIELVDALGQVRMPLQTVQLERIYQFDSAAALGSPGEEELVRDELQREMVDAILRRISAALRR